MIAPPPTSQNITTMSIPTKLKDIHQHVKLYINIFYVNSLVFLATISDIIHYVAIDNIENKKAPTLIKYIKNVIENTLVEVL